MRLFKIRYIHDEKFKCPLCGWGRKIFFTLAEDEEEAIEIFRKFEDAIAEDGELPPTVPLCGECIAYTLAEDVFYE